MAWTDRLKEAAYTAPDGTRLKFQYENVSRAVTKKTTAFDFPDADGTYVQDLGTTSRRYPLRLFFWGASHDLEAQAFEDALEQSGVGTLEHPLYGPVKVVPFGEISRRDDLKTAANQSILEVKFWETTGVLFPTAKGNAASIVLASVDSFKAAEAQNFADTMDLDTAVERVSLKTSYDNLLSSAETALAPIAETQDNVRIEFNSIKDSIDKGIDTLVSDPLTLAFQTTLLLQSPARAATGIEARLDAYSSLAAGIVSGGAEAPAKGSEAANSFHTKDLYASSYVTGAVLSGVNNQFGTKTAAITAAETILDLFASVANWRELNFQALNTIDTGEAYQALQESAALAAGYLVEISFTLKQERSVYLDRARTVVDLVAELYGDIDSNLDEFIAANDLSGDEIVELPLGRRVLYYV